MSSVKRILILLTVLLAAPTLAHVPSDPVQHVLECKSKGTCARDKLATVYVAALVEDMRRRLRTRNEIMRKNAGLPACPISCPAVELPNEGI